MNRPGNDNVPDTAVAQTLYTLGEIMPVSIACVGANAAVLVVALAFNAEDGVAYALGVSVIMAFLGYAVMRHFLSNGAAEPLVPVAMLREAGFRAFLYLEVFTTVILLLMARLSEVTGIVVLEAIGYLLLLFAYAVYGTIFPALVAGTDASLAAARARETARPLVWRLTAALALGYMMMASLILLPGTALQQGMGVDSPIGLFVMAPFAAAISVFTNAMVAVILAKAYQGRYST